MAKLTRSEIEQRIEQEKTEQYPAYVAQQKERLARLDQAISILERLATDESVWDRVDYTYDHINLYASASIKKFLQPARDVLVKQIEEKPNWEEMLEDDWTCECEHPGGESRI